MALIKPPYTQEVYFTNKTKITMRNVRRVEQGNWFHVKLDDKDFILNPDNVNMIKIYRNKKTDYEE